MLRMIGSLLFWAFMALSSLALFPVAVGVWASTVLFDRRLVVLHRFTCFWASLYTWFNPSWSVSIEGREHIDPAQTYVIVSNHQSLLDILVLFRLFRHFKWVSKVENFRVPLIGWNMSLNRYIKLRRGERASVVNMMKACQATLVAGSSVTFFPEGTRSVDGQLRPFKTGAFEAAQRARVPILPLILEGTGDALPKRGFVLQGRHAIRLRVLEPIPYARFAKTSLPALTDEIRDLIARELATRGRAELSA